MAQCWPGPGGRRVGVIGDGAKSASERDVALAVQRVEVCVAEVPARPAPDVHAEGGFHPAVALAGLARIRRPDSPREVQMADEATTDRFHQLIEEIGWTGAHLAQVLGCHRALVWRWWHRQYVIPVPDEIMNWLEALAECHRANPPPERNRLPNNRFRGWHGTPSHRAPQQLPD